MAERRVPRGTDNRGLLLGDLAPGTRVGEFVIERCLGTRGTGHIYRATHPVLPRSAVIHVLPAAEAELRSVALGLMREACVLDAIDHPGMPRVFECGLLPDRRPWIASELVEGRTLADVFETNSVSIADVIAIVRDIADVLAEAHRRGLIHCHVTPSSVVLPARPRRFPLCLVDWVGARTHDSTTPLPLVVGSKYVAPEQASGKLVDRKSDVYSLGRIARDLHDRIVDDEIPPMFGVLLHSMVATDPAERPSMADVHRTAAWLAMELEDRARDVDAIVADPPTLAAEPLAEPIAGDAEPIAADAEPIPRWSEPDIEITIQSAPITSELAAEVAGEIEPRR